MVCILPATRAGLDGELGELISVVVLVLYVVFDLVFIGSYCGDKVASAPESSFGEFFGLLFYPI